MNGKLSYWNEIDNLVQIPTVDGRNPDQMVNTSAPLLERRQR